ncbi:MAG TPA: hypothetical protein VFB37_04345 [Steroidobacteraceae bacterium]|nr:hypothetical protein [Steroidobacteraceae bacterium]
MRHRRSLSFSALLLLGALAGGCDRLGIGAHGAPVADGAPTEQELQKIRYMSSAPSGPKGRTLYTHFEEAKTCGDFELAMRWNRPPNIESGPFNKKMVYVTASIPADLPKNSEVFIRGKIEQGETLPSGAARWYVTLQDGTRVQAIETADFYEKEEQAPQDGGKASALVEPTRAHRIFCGQGVYEGLIGKDPDGDKKIPLLSMLFAMDRTK